MESRETIDHLEQLLENKDFRNMKPLLQEMQDVDIALFLDELQPELALAVFRTLPKERAAAVFSYFAQETQESIVQSVTDQELSRIMEDLSVDDAVDMIEELPANVVKRVLKNANHPTRTLINQFLQYPEHSAGSIMTAEFTDLHSTMTVADAIVHLRTTGENRETIYTCYIIDPQRMLRGVLSVKDLLLAKDDMLVADLMDTHVIHAVTTDDQKTVVQLFSKYDLISLPVVDKESRLVGIVTI
ncbi:MAG: CBS domain-containing protein, partial [Clostridia bacterium]